MEMTRDDVHPDDLSCHHNYKCDNRHQYGKAAHFARTKNPDFDMAFGRCDYCLLHINN
jgi:hypothetical protein